MTKRKTPTKTKPEQRTKRTATEQSDRLPFLEHLNELRRRLSLVVISIITWSAVAYGIEHQIVAWLIEPANGQKFIYTSVGGGISFLFQVCLYVGIALSIPVIVYQSLRYVQPLIGRHSTRFILTASAISSVLAVGGILFGYFLGLPSALKFLLNQFQTTDISALITIQSYLSFVMLYLFGASLMFQVPLVLYLINRIKPLSPRSLFKQERWVVAIALITAALISPSPNPYDLAIIAAPMVISYQIGIAAVWYTNRRRRPTKVQELLARDAAVQAERAERLKTVEYIWQQSDMTMSLAPVPDMAPVQPVPQRTAMRAGRVMQPRPHARQHQPAARPTQPTRHPDIRS